MALKGQPFKKILQTLKAIAPTAAAGLAGPLAPVVHGIVKNALGVSNDDEVAAKLDLALGDPEQAIKLKEIEQRTKQVAQQLGVDLFALEVDDRKSARDLATKTSIAPQLVLSAIFVLGYLGVLALYFHDAFAVPMSEAFMLLLGVLTAGVTKILDFWFGSSSGSKEKTAALSASLVRHDAG